MVLWPPLALFHEMFTLPRTPLVSLAFQCRYFYPSPSSLRWPLPLDVPPATWRYRTKDTFLALWFLMYGLSMALMINYILLGMVGGAMSSSFHSIPFYGCILGLYQSSKSKPNRHFLNIQHDSSKLARLRDTRMSHIASLLFSLSIKQHNTTALPHLPGLSFFLHSPAFFPLSQFKSGFLLNCLSFRTAAKSLMQHLLPPFLHWNSNRKLICKSAFWFLTMTEADADLGREKGFLTTLTVDTGWYFLLL